MTIAEDPRDFARAVLALLDDPDQRMRQGQIAREAVEDYDWARIGERYLQLVERTIHERDRMAAIA